MKMDFDKKILLTPKRALNKPYPYDQIATLDLICNQQIATTLEQKKLAQDQA